MVEVKGPHALSDAERMVDNENAEKMSLLPNKDDMASLFREIWGGSNQDKREIVMPYDDKSVLLLAKNISGVLTAVVYEPGKPSEYPKSSWRAKYYIEYDGKSGEIRYPVNIAGNSDQESDQIIMRYMPNTRDVVGIKSSDLVNPEVKPRLILGEAETKFLDVASNIYQRISERFSHKS